jgi:cytoskeletal protein CcmA (bactofilin family)
MLRKEKKFEKDKTPASSEITGEEKSLLVSGAVAQDEKTIIGEHITIEGRIYGKEHLVIHGSMKGTIELEKHNSDIGTKGRFEGEIHAQNIRIRGQMNGNIKTQGKVEISKEADFIGEIKAKSISIEDGAYFKGAIELEREPNRKLAVTKKENAVSASLPDKESKVLPGTEAKKGS